MADERFRNTKLNTTTFHREDLIPTGDTWYILVGQIVSFVKAAT